MNLNDVRIIILNIKDMLEDMIVAEEITTEMAEELAPTLLHEVLSNQHIEKEYVGD